MAQVRSVSCFLASRVLLTRWRPVWCHTVGLCKGDLLFLVCRDTRTRTSVEVALRAFTLATSHDMREPCNTILVSAAVLGRRACVAAPAGATGSEQQADAVPSETDAHALVTAIRGACGLLLGASGASCGSHDPLR